MNSDAFFALRTGPAVQPDGAPAALTVHDLGVLRVPSGRLGVTDPFVFLDDALIVPIPAGDYPVYLTVADVSAEQDGSHPREAYLSLVLSDAPTASVAAAAVEPDPEESPDEHAEEGGFYAVPVDAGTIGFVDASAVAGAMPADPNAWYDSVFNPEDGGGWIATLTSDTPHPEGTANIVMPLAAAGENVILSAAGWGDGAYPVLESRDADGALTGIHVDLLVVGTLFAGEAADRIDAEHGADLIDPEPAGPDSAHSDER